MMNRQGCFFRNTTNIFIRHLNITGCGRWYDYVIRGGQATLAFYNVINVTIANVDIRNSSGYGLYALCAMGHVNITHSVFAYNEGTACYDGGNVGIRYEKCNHTEASSLSVSFSKFLHGYSENINPLATGLSVFVWTSGVNITLDNITAIGNVAANRSTGGNVAIFLRNRTTILHNRVKVKNSYIANGSAYEGGGLYFSILDTPPYDTPPTTSLTQGNDTPPIPEVVTIENTHFVGNQAGYEGGGLYLITHEDPGILNPIGNVTIRNCVFHNNSLSNESGGGVALHLSNHYVLSYLKHNEPQFYVSVLRCIIYHNILRKESTAALGNVTDGGGMIMCDNSFMILRANTTLLLQENAASHAGGGIFAEDSCLQSEPPCFFQLDIEIYRVKSLNKTVHVHLVNNTAEYAGSAIYGGSVDYCYLFPQLEPDLNQPGSKMFKSIFKTVHPPDDLSPISSEPYRVCFCSENDSMKELKSNCSKRSIEKSVYPGDTLSLYALTVGQYSGSAYHTVLATLWNKSDSQLGHLETSQNSKKNCSQFTYTVFSRLPREFIQLSVQHSGMSSLADRSGYAQVNVTLKQCPVGFIITDTRPYKCDCIPLLASHVKCNIKSKVIRSTFPTWIGFDQEYSSNGSRVWHQMCYQLHCPYDFCKDGYIAIKTGPTEPDFKGDSQCNYNRTGILCGACRPGLSVIFGSAECRKCTDAGLSLLLAFAVAGLLLVLLIILTDLNVSSGSMSGLILYANLVQVSRAAFFGPHVSSTPVYLCSIFISWLNLDFGIKTCFYNGMDAYAKTWLQFAFPLYVWGIALVIILLSRRFPSIAGRNPVKVLATLILLSYAKLLRTMIAALAPAELFLADNKTRTVWREDGNVNYFDEKHTLLFIVAVGFGLVTLPYALVLFLLQWIQKSSNCCVSSWLIKMKPFFDAYTGAYKVQCQFWTGFLLLMRVLLFITFASPHSDPNSRLLLLLITCILVQTVAWSFNGVSRSRATDVVNSLFLLNLGLFSASTCYTITGRGNQVVVILLSVGAAFAKFIFILGYHTFAQIRGTERWSSVEATLREKRESWCPLKRRNGSNIMWGSVVSTNDGNGDKKGVTHTTIEPFDYHYREPLIGSDSDSDSYGSTL